MKKSLFLLIFIGFLQISSVKAIEGNGLRVHNNTNDNLIIYLKPSKLYQLSNMSGMVLKGAIDGALLALQSKSYNAPTGSLVFSYSFNNGEMISITPHETFICKSKKNPHEIYIEGGTRKQGISSFKKSASYSSKYFKIEGKNKLQSQIRVKRGYKTDLYIEKEDGVYNVFATQPYK